MIKYTYFLLLFQEITKITPFVLLSEMKTSTPSVIQWELKRSARLLGHAMLKKSIKCKRVGDLRSTPLLEKERPTINRWMIQFFTG